MGDCFSNLKYLPIYWEWYSDFRTYSVFEFSATERIRKSLLCTQSLYLSGLEGTKSFCAIPKALQKVFYERPWEWLTWESAIIFARTSVMKSFFSKVKNFSPSTLLRKNSTGEFRLRVLLTKYLLPLIAAIFLGNFYFVTCISWGARFSLDLSRFLQHRDLSISAWGSASFGALKNMIVSLVWILIKL